MLQCAMLKPTCIGSLKFCNFAKQDAKIDCLKISFSKLIFFQNITYSVKGNGLLLSRNLFSNILGGQFELNYCRGELKNIN